MKTARFTIAVTIALAAIALSSCSDDSHITDNSSDNAVHLHATVLGLTCPFTAARPVSAITGEAATVEITGDTCNPCTVETDDASELDLDLDTGSYTIIVSTGFSYPSDTTHDVQLLPGDTSLSFTVQVRTLDPLNITFVFRRSAQSEPMTVDEEWAVLSELNRLTQVISGKRTPALDIMSSEASDWRFVSGDYVVYELPIIRWDSLHGDLYNVIEVTSTLDILLEGDTTGLAPPGFYLYPSGTYPCPAGN